MKHNLYVTLLHKHNIQEINTIAYSQSFAEHDLGEGTKGMQ